MEMTTEVTATSSEIRPPCIRRASTSRPTPSVPNQWLADRPLVEGQQVDIVGGIRPPERIGQDTASENGHEDATGPTSADPIGDEPVERPGERAFGANERRNCSQLMSGHLDAGIDSRIGDVGQEVDEDDAGADDQRRAHDHRIVAGARRH